MEERYNKADEVKKIQRDVNVLVRFIGIFCASNHSDNTKSRIHARGRAGEFLKDISIKLCPDCTKLLFHGVGKRIICPYDPKPRCKRCPTYCYHDGYRQKIKQVMRFSGAYLLKRGRLDLAFKYFF